MDTANTDSQIIKPFRFQPRIVKGCSSYPFQDLLQLEFVSFSLSDIPTQCLMIFFELVSHKLFQIMLFQFLQSSFLHHKPKSLTSVLKSALRLF